MATKPEQDEGSGGHEGPTERPTESSHIRPHQADPVQGPNLTPATKQDISDLLHKMRQLHAADLDLLKTEIMAVTARTQASEEDILDLRQEVQGLKETLHQLQNSQATLTTRVAQAEDRHRHINIKILGIPDSFGITELPHYLRQLTTSLMLHAQAKKLNFEGFYRIPKPRQASPQASQDVIVRCHSTTGKAQLMATVRGKTPLNFEASQLLPRHNPQHTIMAPINAASDQPTTQRGHRVTVGITTHTDSH
ncbi:Hypothetical predicted protein [Pelobates cultripes]|uniref:Uncharacterized protein n=1 Tax=Pelobates cultripes TaxID=61616 RepID=A0AAD1VLB1_PELCU|nr:Hypothetical predicted protein [Pelobates cultripes]